MLVLLPWHGERRIIHAIDTTYRLIGIVSFPNKRVRLYNQVPSGVARELPVIIGPYFRRGRFWRLKVSRPKTSKITPSSLRRLILDTFKAELIEERVDRKPLEIFQTCKSSIKWLSRYYVVTNWRVYCGGFEPPEFTCNRYLINNNVLIAVS